MPRPLAALLLASALASLLAAAPPAAAAPLANRPVSDDIFYQFMPIAWRDSDNDAARFGDFAGMTASIPYLKSLGVTAVWMTPVFPSPAYHGYQHGPANELNPWFGSETQFRSFIAAAHAESIKVFIDFVAYHISQNSLWFLDSHLNPASPYTDYLAYFDPHVANSLFDGGSYTTWNGSPVGQIKWRLDHPAVTSLLESWTAHWLDPNGDGDPSDGIDGYRLDHVLADEGWGYTMGWWQHWKSAMRAVNPDVFTFAEQADWGSHGQDLLSAHDAAFTKPFLFAARQALALGVASGLYSEMAATLASLPPGRTYLGSLGDHDVDRLSTSIGGTVARAKAAAAVLLLQPFPPVIYYGDELAMRGARANFGSDNNDIPVREPFKWNAVAGPPMSNYFVLNPTAFNARTERDNDGRSVQEEQGVGGSVLETYRTLTQLRRTHPALRRGQYDAVPNSGAAVWAFARTAASEETVLVAINLANTVANVALDLSAFTLGAASVPVRDVVSGAALTALTNANRGSYVVSVPASGYRVLSARVAPPAAPARTSYDGSLVSSDFANGTRIATQTTPTAMGDNLNELDQMFVRADPDGLALGITGNLATDGSGLALFFDTVPGGQDSLATSAFPQPPSGLPEASGLGFDTGFAPDYCLWINAFFGDLYADLYTLSTGGGGSKRYLGGGVTGNGYATLSGGSNPNGLLVALSNANTVGVTSASASGAATAASGLEAKIPWADIQASGPDATLRVLAAIIRPDGLIGNQFLPGLGASQTTLIGYAPTSLKEVPGAQYALISPLLSAPPHSGPAVFALRAGPNPFHRSTTVRLTLPTASPVRLEVLDISGRCIRTLVAGSRPPGEQAIAWDGRDDAGAPAAPGLYLIRAQAAGRTSTARVVLTR